jgi:hypothetical protein
MRFFIRTYLDRVADFRRIDSVCANSIVNKSGSELLIRRKSTPKNITPSTSGYDQKQRGGTLHPG